MECYYKSWGAAKMDNTLLLLLAHIYWLQQDSNPQLYGHYNHLVRKRTLNHLAKLAKWLSCVVSAYLYGAFNCVFFSCHIRVLKWIYTLNAWMSKNSLLKTGEIFESCVTAILQSINFQMCQFRARISLTSGNYKVEIHSKTCMDTVHEMACFLRELSSKALKV